MLKCVFLLSFCKVLGKKKTTIPVKCKHQLTTQQRSNVECKATTCATFSQRAIFFFSFSSAAEVDVIEQEMGRRKFSYCLYMSTRLSKENIVVVLVCRGVLHRRDYSELSELELQT